MKKLLLLFASVFLYMGSFAVTGNPLPIAPGDTGYTSVTTSVYVSSISFVGNYQKYIIVQQIGDSIWLNGYTTQDSGIGIKTNSITGLYRATNYRWAVVFRKGNAFDTLFGGTFRTLSVPNFPTITVQKIQKIGVSMLVINVVGDIHLTSSIFGLYYSPSYQMTNIIHGTGMWTDTLRLSTPNASTTYGYCLQFLPDTITGLKDSLMCYGELITTPMISDGSVSNQSVTGVTEDSATISVTVQLGTYAGTIQFHVKDPDSSSYLQSSPIISVNTNGNYSYTFGGLSDGKDYSYVVIFRDTLDNDTLSGHFTTLVIPKTPAPAVTFFGGTWADCGKAYVSLKVTPVFGDTCRFVILRRVINTTTWDTIYVRNLLTAMLTLNDLELSAPFGGTRFEFRVIGYSKDNTISQSSIINVLTPAGDIPAMSVQVEGMAISPTPYITFTSHAMCDFSTVTYNVTKNNNNTLLVSDSIEVGTMDGYQGRINLPNFDNGTYHVEVCIVNRYGSPDCYEQDFIRSLATGIIQHKPESFDPNSEVDVANLNGQLLGKFRFNELNHSGIPKQAVILHYVKKLNEEEYSWKHVIE